MTKHELMKNYTMEQLADMVVEKYNREKSEERPYGAHYDLEDGKAIRFIGFDRKEAEQLFEMITSKGMNENKCSCGKENEINELKCKLKHKEEIINQIDDILNELFGVKHDVTDKVNEFREILKEIVEKYKKEIDKLKAENADLHCEIQSIGMICGEMPHEPIEAASALINSTYTIKKSDILKSLSKAFGNDSDTVTESMYSVSELRQIAEHLLVYCNANGEECNE